MKEGKTERREELKEGNEGGLGKEGRKEGNKGRA